MCILYTCFFNFDAHQSLSSLTPTVDISKHFGGLHGRLRTALARPPFPEPYSTNTTCDIWKAFTRSSYHSKQRKWCEAHRFKGPSTQLCSSKLCFKFEASSVVTNLDNFSRKGNDDLLVIIHKQYNRMVTAALHKPTFHSQHGHPQGRTKAARQCRGTHSLWDHRHRYQAESLDTFNKQITGTHGKLKHKQLHCKLVDNIRF